MNFSLFKTFYKLFSIFKFIVDLVREVSNELNEVRNSRLILKTSKKNIKFS